MAHANETLARAYLEALIKADARSAETLVTDDVIFHIPGHSPFAGEYKGRDLLRQLQQVMESSGSTIEITEIHDVLASDEHAVALVRAQTTRLGQILAWSAVITFHMREGKISKIWVCQSDQYAVDRFLR